MTGRGTRRPTDGLPRYERWLNALTTVEAAQRDLFVECPIGHPTLFARADAVAYRPVGSESSTRGC